ncbi:MAG: MFS transporter [Solirubrobacteraceae bacterium]
MTTEIQPSLVSLPTKSKASRNGVTPLPVSPDSSRRWIVLAVCSLSLFMVQLDNTIVNVALPSVEHQFRGSVSSLQWVVDAYVVVLACLLLLGGSVGDRIGRRRVLRTGLVIFSAASLACSFATSVSMLIAFRVAQAIGGAMLNPNSLSIVTNTFTDRKQRARAIGIWSAVMGLSMAAGPIVGGALIVGLNWRAVFWVNVPIGLIALVLLGRFVPESKAAKPRRLDPPGQLLAIAALGSLTYGIIEAPSSGLTSATVLGAFVAAAVALTLFIVVERHQAEPLIDLRFFHSPAFSGATLMGLLSFFIVAGWLFLNTLYLQEVRDYSPLMAGVATLPAFALMIIVAPFTGRIVAHRGPRIPVMVAGLALMGGATLLTLVQPHSSYFLLASSYLLIGGGYGMVNPPVTTLAVNGMPLSQGGAAGGLIGTFRQVGSALGIAVLGSIMASDIHGQILGRLHAANLPTALAGKLSKMHAVTGSLGGTGMPLRAERLLADAFTAATHTSWAVAAAGGLLIVTLALFTAGREPRETAHASVPSLSSSTT